MPNFIGNRNSFLYISGSQSYEMKLKLLLKQYKNVNM